MGSDRDSQALHDRVQAMIRGAAAAGDTFETLALEIARFQARHVAPVARLVRARGLDLERIVDPAELPAVPCDAFRLARVAAHPPDGDERVFRTSGTSAEGRGEHAFRTTETYERAALVWGSRMLLPGVRAASIALAPPLRDAPDSSLAFMIDLFARALGGPATWHVRAADGAIDVDGLRRACGEARRLGLPAVVLGTSFAFVHLSETVARGDLRLPPESRVMQTGGFKGRSREVEPADLRRAVSSIFGVPEGRIVSEYGMTELSSQLYDGVLAGGPHDVHVPPPWVRVSAADPATLAPLPDGEIGIARIVDLANVDSAVAIQTSDRVRVTPQGVALLGRQPGATPRGCSLALDALREGA